MSVLRGDKLKPSMQAELCHLLTLHACVCNFLNAHLILFYILEFTTTTTPCKTRNSIVSFLSDLEE